MHRKITTASWVLMFASALRAANVTFPGSGGDLASATDWGGTPPGVNDTAVIDKAGVYTLSEDRTFQSLSWAIPADGTVSFSFNGRCITTSGNISGGNKADATVVFDACRFNLSGSGIFTSLWGPVSGMTSVMTNGCIVTNVSKFFAGNYSSSSRAVVAGESQIFAEECRVANSGSVGITFEISDGAQVHVDRHVYYETSGTTGEYGGSRIIVSGMGSLFHQKGGTSSSPYFIQIGGRFTNDGFTVTDDASAISDYGGVILCNKGDLTVENGASATFPNIRFSGSGNLAIVSNATLSCATAFSLAYTKDETLYNPAGHSNNVLIATGPDTEVGLRGPDLFGTGHHNAILVEKGAQLSQLSSFNELMSQTCGSRFHISGQGTSVGKANSYFNVAYTSSAGTVNSTNNVVFVADGATLLASRIYLGGVANRLNISNATVSITGGSVALYVGSRGAGTTSTNNVVEMQGETPKITVSTDTKPCRFYGGSTLRFCVPSKGYATGFVPFDVVCGFEMDSLSELVLDCEEWAARTGGTLHLIHSKSFLDNVDTKGTTVARLRATALPPDCTLTVSDGDVYLKCPIRKGTTFIFR